MIKISKTNLKAEDKRKLFFECGGRCSICAESLSYDNFTRGNINIREHAHIIGDSEDGARGDRVKSKLYAADINNIILLCPTCHTKVDKETGYYTVHKLHQIKCTHIERVNRLLDSLKGQEATVVKYVAKIGKNMPPFSDEKVNEAVRESGFFAHRYVIDLNPNNTALTDSNENFWKNEWIELETKYNQEIKRLKERNAIQNILLFAIAPIPLLIRLGILFGDLTDLVVFQKRREPDTWKWDAISPESIFTIQAPAEKHDIVAVKLSLSDKIPDNRVHSILGEQVSIWDVTHQNPNNDFIKHPVQLSSLRETYRELFRKVREKHGQDTKIHVFPACPVSAAIEFGRAYMPKADLPLVLYDQNWETRGFSLAYEINL